MLPSHGRSHWFEPGIDQTPRFFGAFLFLTALHDWEVHRMYYDYDSLNGQRKAHDALHTLEYAMGVCEGYANLFTALERVRRFGNKEVTRLVCDYAGLDRNNSWRRRYQQYEKCCGHNQYQSPVRTRLAEWLVLISIRCYANPPLKNTTTD